MRTGNTAEAVRKLSTEDGAYYVSVWILSDVHYAGSACGSEHYESMTLTSASMAMGSIPVLRARGFFWSHHFMQRFSTGLASAFLRLAIPKNVHFNSLLHCVSVEGQDEKTANIGTNR